MNYTELWLLITAIVFTFVGMSFKRSSGDIVKDVIEATVDRLIEDEYIKTRLDNEGNIQLMKYHEEYAE
tara:strand:+ start:288 stop:494 length:207 start_codon:yes stop_codon:yes gene_type:complete